MNESEVVGVIVLNDNGEVLLLLKPEGVGPYPGTYLTPGGGIEPGETPEECAVREVREETHIEITDLKFLTKTEFTTGNWRAVMTHFIGHMFTARYKSGELPNDPMSLPEPMRVIRWVSKEEAKTLPLSPPAEQIIEKLKFL